MRRGCYKKVSKEEKVRIVSLVLAGKGIRETVRSTGTSDTTLRMWLADETINPNKEYALKFREEHSWHSFFVLAHENCYLFYCCSALITISIAFFSSSRVMFSRDGR